MIRWRTMSSTQKAFTIVAFTLAGALALYWSFVIKNRRDPPIIIGDGSVTFYADKIDKKSDTELEALKSLHKVRSLVVTDANSGATSTPIDLKGLDWTITNASGVVNFSTDPQLLGLQAGVKGDCPAPWKGGGTDYTCDPGNGSKLTPATLKIQGQNCPPGSAQQSCTLTCASGKCRVELEYK